MNKEGGPCGVSKSHKHNSDADTSLVLQLVALTLVYEASNCSQRRNALWALTATSSVPKTLCVSPYWTPATPTCCTDDLSFYRGEPALRPS